MNALKKITVLIAEDHAIVRQGICKLLEAEGNFDIVGQTDTGREAVALYARHRPAIVLMDIAMPELNGNEATRQILAADPAARIIMLSAHSDDEFIESALAVGAVGFLEKQSSVEILATAIRAVVGGQKFFGPTVAKRLADSQRRAVNRDGVVKPGAIRLTSRETEVLQLVAEGKANKQVAGVLNISIKTVEKHRQHLMDKLNIHDTAGLTRYAISTGVIESRVRLPIL